MPQCVKVKPDGVRDGDFKAYSNRYRHCFILVGLPLKEGVNL